MPLHRTGPVYRVSKEPEAIMNEIIVSGPVQGMFLTAQAFFCHIIKVKWEMLIPSSEKLLNTSQPTRTEFL